MIGKRNDASELSELKVGEYGKINGFWYCIPPGTNEMIGNINGHKITEHEDGTITVEPSIKIDNGREIWHGYLERGVWRVY